MSKPTPDLVLDQIYKAFGDLTKFLETHDTKYLEYLPKVYRDNPVKLLQHSIIFSIIILDVRRGREGLADLGKDTYSLCQEGAFKYFKKIRGEGSKNHQSDSEKLGNNGIISFCQGSHGFNPGLLLSIHLNHLNSACDGMFQKPKDLSPSEMAFEQEWYYNCGVGKNPLGCFLPNLLKELKLPHFTNHSLRTSAIEILKNNGYSDREFMKVSGHKRIDSLNHYNPSTSLTEKSKIAQALVSAGSSRSSTSNVISQYFPTSNDFHPQGRFPLTPNGVNVAGPSKQVLILSQNQVNTVNKVTVVDPQDERKEYQILQKLMESNVQMQTANNKALDFLLKRN